MDTPLLIALVAVGVAGLAAVIAIWMERDPRRPPRWAWSLSLLILMATGVSMFQSYIDSREAEKMQEDMARMLQQLDRIAASGENPELAAYVSSELSAQARANPQVIEMVAQRVADEGGDPADMLSKHMQASDVEGIARDGKLKTKPKATSAKAEEPARQEAKKPEAEPAEQARPARRGASVIGGGADAGPGGGRPGLLQGSGDGEKAPEEGAKAAEEGAKAPRGGISLGGTTTEKTEAPAKKPRPGGLPIPSAGADEGDAPKTSIKAKTGSR
jgi:hypothetical protein